MHDNVINMAFGLKHFMSAKKGIQLSRKAVQRLQDELSDISSELARLNSLETVARRFVMSQGIVQQALAMCDPAKYERATGKVVTDTHTYVMEAHQALVLAQKSMLNCNIDLVKELKMDAPHPQQFGGKNPPQPQEDSNATLAGQGDREDAGPHSA